MKIIERYQSPNFDARPDNQVPDMLIFHYTGMKTGAEALERLIDPKSKVSAHYFVEENGEIYCLVSEAYRAWHAGLSFWANKTSLNDCSIGIEIVNPGHDWGYRPFPASQMASVLMLAQELKRKYGISDNRMLGHSDVAPSRKQDPGELFDWKFLSDNGVGLWSEAGHNGSNEGLNVTERERFKENLSALGMDTSDFNSAVVAFQRHWCPHNCTGVADRYTSAILEDIVRQSRAAH